MSRRSELASVYGFECSCVLCGLDASARGASEARQRRMAEIHALLPRFPPDLSKLVTELLSLLRQEGAPGGRLAIVKKKPKTKNTNQ